MPFSIISNLKLKRVVAVEEPSPSHFPLSLSLPLPLPLSLSHSLLEEGGVSLCSTRTTVKLYKFGSTNSFWRIVFAGCVAIVSVIFTRQLLSWWSQMKHVFILLWSNVTRISNVTWIITARFHTTWFLRGKGISKKVDRGNLPRELLPGKGISKKVDRGNLPRELCENIGKRVQSRVDILCFRSVCKQWRSCLPFPDRFPLFVPPPPSCGDYVFPTIPYCVTEVGFYRLESSSGCVSLVIEEVDKGGTFRVHTVNPRFFKFTSSMIPFMASRKHPLSQLSYHSKAYHIRMVLPHFDSNNNWVQGRREFRKHRCVKKAVIISSNPDDDGVNLSYARASDLTVVAHLGWGSLMGRLALLRLGGSPENWVWETDFCTQVFEDIATYRGQLCALDSLGRVFLMDHNSRMTQLSPPSSIPCEMEVKHLFEAFGNLYLAELFVYSRRAVAYVLNLQLQKWVKVEDIGEQISALVPFLV